ncbi:hypothetical protein GGI26_004322 [Coemansia sp. RSA 1358]|nr:hypothetical protein EDC05_001700 [Coemansia umbellata]KAJ2621249.1 hypothetical protein GGI26_004322 [Coemansia sp. RSA 1358]
MSNNGSLATLEELRAKAQARDVEMTGRICLDMSHFKAVMRQLRKVDDNIILRMNTTNTAEVHECFAVFQILQTAYRRRERDINMCLRVLDEKIAEAKESKSPKMFSLETQRDWVSNERGVEDIVRKRSLDVFKSRCQLFEFPKEFEDFLNQRKIK